MSEIALALYVLYIALAFGLRTALQVRRTGSTGFHGVSGRPGSPEWLAGIGFVIALVLGLTAPLLAVLGATPPIAALEHRPVQIAGIVLTLGGIAATLYAQGAMGTAWRIGVDPSERTQLVTGGPYAHVRNPIFAAMLPTAAGLALIVPNWVALLAFATLLVAVELQVRIVEEPYLARTHGTAYNAYAARVGRFIPGSARCEVDRRLSGSAGLRARWSRHGRSAVERLSRCL